MKLAYIGQNQDSGLYPKKSGVIFFKAKLLNPKHGAPTDMKISRYSFIAPALSVKTFTFFIVIRLVTLGCVKNRLLERCSHHALDSIV